MHSWNDQRMIGRPQSDNAVAAKAIAEANSIVDSFRNLVDFSLKDFGQVSGGQVEAIVKKPEIHPAILKRKEFPFHNCAGKNKQS